MTHGDEKKLKGKRGIDVLRDPELNKSIAFADAERDALGLTGLLPSGCDSEETQIQRVMLQLETKNTDLERYIYLMNLLDTNEALFYKVLMSDRARLQGYLQTWLSSGGQTEKHSNLD